MRVLVAEDDRGLREVLVQGLEEAGYFVDAVAAGDEAIEQLRFYEYDVAVIDWRMPRVSGLEVVVLGTPQQPPDGDAHAHGAGHPVGPDRGPRCRR